jgi:hypothetical protein
MAPAVEPSPEPIALLEDEAVEALEVAADEPVVMRSEKRLEEPRVVPRLEAGELPAAEPEVSAEEDVLVDVLEEAIAVVETVTVVEVALTLEAFEVEFREETRFPLMLLRLPRNCGAISAAKRSAWMAPLSRTVRLSSPVAITAVRKAVAEGPLPPFSGGLRLE